MKLEAIKDGNGNIIITEDSFEMLLICLDNQKFVHEAPQNGDSLSVGEVVYKNTQAEMQSTIDEYNRAGRKILHQKYIFETIKDGYWLTKRYEHQDTITPWSGNDVGLVYELFKDTRIKWEKPNNLKPIPEETPWLIERPIRCDNEYLSISEDGHNNRPWKLEEVEQIKKSFNNYKSDEIR